MGFKRIDVRVTDSTLSTIEKQAFSNGKSVSEIVRNVLDAAFNNPSETGEGSVVEEQRAGPPREIDTDKIRDTVSEALLEVLKRGGGGVSPEALRYLVADVARIAQVLKLISLEVFSPDNYKKHEERYRIADQKADRILKKLNLFEVENVDRIEIKETTKEETDQILKEMGINRENGKVMGAGGEK